ncbi:SDR family NAD(P)-dependent oxidoreductase [Desulfosporosinus sp. PR]|uniref:SDR family NAD(P)-dependent oxidoreductase n=1 Tax=Candidatus Desulfosporosinus nitrosoreducens TaxID=3401928 RepID=UPI0027E6AB80|nr:SDR family NAD(P)-dependent oxidoreductase [Desulfosporosinus sp. PR]MDQ7095429.1 SDR family NAD(P)-dependent oxidoreductase [Desulfosporosinus sp. PR]
MDYGPYGRVAIVTGSAKGIGKGEAMVLARQGLAVVVADIDVTAAEKTAEEIRAEGCQAISVSVDVSNSNSVKEMVNTVYNELGSIDILVNNAGIVGRHVTYDIVNMPEESWDAMIDVHLKGTFLCTKFAAPYMIKQNWGRIINTSSLHARTGARHGFSSYGAAKAGITQFTRVAAKEFGPEGITVNSVAPGYVVTTALPIKNEYLDFIKEQIPIGRFATAEDIGNAVAFLASNQAEYINGANIEVNGGRVEFYYKGCP